MNLSAFPARADEGRLMTKACEIKSWRVALICVVVDSLVEGKYNR